MTGFRIGWAIAARPVVEVMTNVQAQTTSCPAPILQAAAEGALTGIQSVTDSLRMTMGNHRNVALRELAALPGVRTVPPEGTFYCLPDFRAYRGDSVDLASSGGDRPRPRVRHGRTLALELRWVGARRRRWHCPYPLGARPQRTGGNLHRGPQAG